MCNHKPVVTAASRGRQQIGDYLTLLREPSSASACWYLQQHSVTAPSPTCSLQLCPCLLLQHCVTPSFSNKFEMHDKLAMMQALSVHTTTSTLAYPHACVSTGQHYTNEFKSNNYITIGSEYAI